MLVTGRTKAAALAVGIVALAAPSPAAAAAQIGATFNPSSNCGSNLTALQGASPNGKYAAPSAGVITMWSFQSDASPPSSLKLKIGRPLGGSVFEIVGESPTEFPAPSMLNTYTEVRIPVQPGDVIGYYTGVNPPGEGHCVTTDAAYTAYFAVGDQPPGTTADFGSGLSARFDLSAVLEPDADNDGFGDETQDGCPAEAETHGPCVPPVTTITKGPKAKTKKKVATFEFSATDPGSSFQCSLDGKTEFKVCASPFVVKVKKGKHTFEVRATDPGGTVEVAPASFSWKVKKPK